MPSKAAAGTSEPPCAMCGRPAALRCGRCKAVRYCSQDCATAHWKASHGSACAGLARRAQPTTTTQTSTTAVASQCGLFGPAGVAPSRLPSDFPVSVRPPLESCVATWDRQGRGPGPFFPCCPPWTSDAVRYARLVLGAVGAGAMAEAIVERALHQREMDRRWRALALHVYAGIPDGTQLPAEEHIERYRKYGWDLTLPPGMYTVGEVVSHQTGLELSQDWDPTTVPAAAARCEKCRRTIALADPPECLCGEVYCSVECHDADWSAHRSTCATVAENNELALMLTRRSWQEALQPQTAWVPRPDMRDFQHEARVAVNGGRPIVPQQWRAECQFYDAEERPAMRRRVTALQDEFRARVAAGESVDSPMASNLAAAVASELTWQFLYYRQALPSDSAGRCLFKVRMLLVYDEVTRQMSAGQQEAAVAASIAGQVREAHRRALRAEPSEICEALGVDEATLLAHGTDWRGWFAPDK